MPKKSAKPGLISADQLKAILKRHELRQDDVAWMTGVGVRQARAWQKDEYPVPRYAALILQAFDEGKINARWLRKHIGFPPPGWED